MNPYESVRRRFLEWRGSTFTHAGVDAVLLLMSEQYPGDLDASDRPFDYVARHVIEKLGDQHPISRALFVFSSEVRL
jgi:hypothetical protein